MANQLRVHLFGSPQVALAEGARPAALSRKGWALLAYLARHRQPVTRAALAGLLWNNAPEPRARRNLSRELVALTALLPASIEADYHTVAWRHAGAWVDANAAEALLRSQPTQPATEALTEAVALYRGAFMAGLFLDDCAEFESWLVHEREFWGREVGGALGRLIAHHSERGTYEPAQQLARRWLELEPWQEDAHRALMTALARAGRRADALAHFESCRRALALELDAPPGPVTFVLYEEIRAGLLDPLPAPPFIAPTVSLARAVAPEPPQAMEQPWSPVPSVPRFYGRVAEAGALRNLLEAERCRVIAVLGMGGMGKTTLAAWAAREFAPSFDAVVWRSLLNAPPLHELLRSCLPALGAPPSAIPAAVDDQLALLLECLRQRRCLLVLDNAESLLLDGARVGQFRPGHEAYGQLLRIVASYEHGSSVLLTSRELPPPLAQLAAESPLVAVLRIGGLDADAGGALLSARGVAASGEAAALVARYSGNPLALALVADAIHEGYGGDLAAFLADDALLFDDIRAVLDQQWARLTPFEQDVLLWLAVRREPSDREALRALLVPPAAARAVLDALRSLQRRSLVEPGEARFSLQNVVLEYLSAQLTDAVCEEVSRGEWRRFASHALMLAQSPEYVRQSQERLLLAPVAQRLVARSGLAGLKAALLKGLAAQRDSGALVPGYAAGNALNLLLHAGADVRDADLSRLCVWQADLRGARLPGVSFAGSDLRGSLFTETLCDSYALAWSPDGALIASGVGGGEIRLWRTSDWQLVGRCAGANSFVWHLAFSPAGDRLASCDHDGEIRVWDVAACQPVYLLRGHQRSVEALAWSPDGQRLVSGSSDGTARIWHVERAAVLHTLCDHTDRIRWVAWSPDGALVATASFDCTVMLWNGDTGEHVATLPHPEPVQSLDWHPGSLLLATSCRDYQVRLWDVQSGTVARTLADTAIFVHQLAFSPDGRALAGGGGPKVRVWNAETGQLRAAMPGHNQNVTYAIWSPDGSRVASRSLISIRVWDLASQQPLAILQGTSLETHTLAVSADERLVASSHVDGLLRIWELASGAVLHTLHGPTDATIGMSFSPDGATLATAGLDGYLRIWDAQRGTERRVLQPARTTITCLARSADGRLLATGCHDGTVWIWDWERGRARAVLRAHTMLVTCVAFAPDGLTLYSSSDDHALCRWDLAREQLIGTLPSEGRSFYGLACSPTGEMLYGACNDEQLRVWDLRTGQLARRLRAGAAMMGLTLSPDGKRLASHGSGEVCVWHLASDAAALTLRHAQGVGTTRFTREGRELITGSGDGNLRVWDANTGALLRELLTPGSYQGMNIAGATGLTIVQREALHLLGANDEA